MAVVFNLVPTLASMVKGYLFSEEPAIDVKGDADLQAFLDDCDGSGVDKAIDIGSAAMIGH